MRGHFEFGVMHHHLPLSWAWAPAAVPGAGTTDSLCLLLTSLCLQWQYVGLSVHLCGAGHIYMWCRRPYGQKAGDAGELWTGERTNTNKK